MSTTLPEGRSNTQLTLPGLVGDLQAAGLISDADALRLGGAGIANIHPLVFLAEQKLVNKASGAPLDMANLLAWLADQSGQTVYQIDPLKINVGAIAEVMSKAFAQRHHILAVDVGTEEVTIASGEPFVSVWESNLEHVLRKRVRRVLADPRDIARHTAEFYTMAGSVRGAHGAGREASVAGVTNLEQMLELGAMQDPDANDQHIVSIVDWLLQYAFEQRASDIHIEPRR